MHAAVDAALELERSETQNRLRSRMQVELKTYEMSLNSELAEAKFAMRKDNDDKISEISQQQNIAAVTAEASKTRAELEALRSRHAVELESEKATLVAKRKSELAAFEAETKREHENAIR